MLRVLILKELISHFTNFPKLVKYTKKSGDDVSAKFVGSLENNIKKICEEFKFQKKIIFREKD